MKSAGCDDIERRQSSDSTGHALTVDLAKRSRLRLAGQTQPSSRHVSRRHRPAGTGRGNDEARQSPPMRTVEQPCQPQPTTKRPPITARQSKRCCGSMSRGRHRGQVKVPFQRLQGKVQIGEQPCDGRFVQGEASVLLRPSQATWRESGHSFIGMSDSQGCTIVRRENMLATRRAAG